MSIRAPVSQVTAPGIAIPPERARRHRCWPAWRPATGAQRDELALTPEQPPGEIYQWITDLAAGHRTFAWPASGRPGGWAVRDRSPERSKEPN
jgi:hypothetical protein